MDDKRVIPSLQVDFFKNPTVEPSTSSYGRWVVKYSPIHFRFFWKKQQAVNFIESLDK